MLSIKLRNDGKEKPFSFEAHVDEFKTEIYLSGYGASKEEALADLKEQVAAKIKELQNIDYDNQIWVNCLGEPLKK